jgi:hypothetical protein
MPAAFAFYEHETTSARFWVNHPDHEEGNEFSSLYLLEDKRLAETFWKSDDRGSVQFRKLREN